MHTIGRLARQCKLLRSTLLYYDCIAASRARAMDKDGWVQLLRATGLSDDDMDRWHAEFERLAPEAHQDFLESLDIGVREVATIRPRLDRIGVRTVLPGQPGDHGCRLASRVSASVHFIKPALAAMKVQVPDAPRCPFPCRAARFHVRPRPTPPTHCRWGLQNETGDRPESETAPW